jgi:hypothetical protein
MALSLAGRRTIIYYYDRNTSLFYGRSADAANYAKIIRLVRKRADAGQPLMA